MAQKDPIREIVEGREPLAVVGLGYVGLPLAVAFARKVKTIGFDINEKKVEAYKNGRDVTREVGDEAVKSSAALFTSDPAELRKAAFVIVAVPTPVDDAQQPGPLRPWSSATRHRGEEPAARRDRRVRIHRVPRRHRGRLRADPGTRNRA